MCSSGELKNSVCLDNRNGRFNRSWGGNGIEDGRGTWFGDSIQPT